MSIVTKVSAKVMVEERSTGMARHARPLCVNCDTSTRQLARLYCSELCRQEAKAVRYGRAVHRDGRIEQLDVREALTIKLGLVAGGGYPEHERELSPDQRAAIFERDGHLCRICGASATEIDHLDYPGQKQDVNHPDNLQALCAACHRTKTLDAFRPATGDEIMKLEQLWARIHAPEPLRACDDERRWNSDWRGLLAQRKAKGKPLTS